MFEYILGSDCPYKQKINQIMKKIAALYVLLLVLVSGTLFADTASTLQEFDANLDKTAAQLVDSAFAAVVINDGKIIFDRY